MLIRFPPPIGKRNRLINPMAELNPDIISAKEAWEILNISAAYFYMLKKRFGKEELAVVLRKGTRVFYSRRKVEALAAKGWTS
jgi:hypothetical protein